MRLIVSWQEYHNMCFVAPVVMRLNHVETVGGCSIYPTPSLRAPTPATHADARGGSAHGAAVGQEAWIGNAANSEAVFKCLGRTFVS